MVTPFDGELTGRVQWAQCLRHLVTPIGGTGAIRRAVARMLEAEFRNPPADYRPVAMWFLNGRIESDEVRRQIAAMADGGIGGIQVAARTGLETPYLSERWFELIRLVELCGYPHNSTYANSGIMPIERV